MKHISYLLVVFILLLSGCGTFSLETDSKMTRSIFLKNLKPIKTIYLVKTNTAPVDDEIGTLTKAYLQARGYSFVKDPDDATYILRINTININNHKQQNIAKGAAIAGGTTGIVGYASNGGSAGIEGLVVGAAIGGTFAYLVSDGQVRMQVDVLITESIDKEEFTHKTRVIAEAKQVHLTPEEGQPILEKKISKQIAGIFL